MIDTATNPTSAEIDLKAIWARVHARLEQQIGTSAYNLWCARLEFQSRQGSTVHLSVPTDSLRHWISTHYIPQLTTLWAEYGVTKVVIKKRGVELVAPPPQIQAPRRVPRRGVISRVSLEDPPSEKLAEKAAPPKLQRTIADEDLPKLPLLPAPTAEEITHLRTSAPQRFTIENVARRVSVVFNTTDFAMIAGKEQNQLIALRITMRIAIDLLKMTPREVASALGVNYKRVASGLSHLERLIAANPPLKEVIERLKILILRG